ncbi:alanine/ornithine racemase family PLP-dependent enzyme [Shouchella lonarensis]|uniref:Predicted amino acid racemase n=1 Tax=Shouchella lonarensis TaxID=1464122 RepID=A0A1G6HSK1_9BACI|nr:alanine/ornithine racemase family PLP-dependent enzyme [Shouchella lonarensis]SDB97202.1 Predicted amino acid racemase [Shouchella lonarensis]
MKPLLHINLAKIKHNTASLVKTAHAQGLKVAGITKGCCGNIAFAEAQMAAGVDFLADSRIENLKNMHTLNIKKMLLRSPRLSEVDDVVTHADYSLNSSTTIIRALGAAATKKQVTHAVILMIDIGDLREGIWHENTDDIYHTARVAIDTEGIELVGIGTNVTCLGGIMPTVENYQKVITIAKEIRREFSIPLPIVSGGNSSILPMLYEEKIPTGITHLRINQSIFLGIEIGYGNPIPNWASDIVTLQAEMIEVQTKPSYPQGERAQMNAFGAIPTFKDKGTRRRAIVALGRQDMDLSGLIPTVPGITIEGASSDHVVLDITDSPYDYDVGEAITFRVSSYASMITAMASHYIDTLFH